MKRRLRFLAWLPFVLVVIGYLYFCGWRIPGGKAIAESWIVSSNQHVAEFDRLYPGSEHFISYYTGVYGQPRWNSSALLFGRYELTMSFDIELNRLATSTEPIEPALFVVNPRRHVQDTGGGSKTIWYDSTGGLEFGLDEWERVVEADGDLSVLGIDVIRNSPITESSEPATRMSAPAALIE